MKRNPETIRKILSNPSKYAEEPIEDESIKYHLSLLSDAKLIEGDYIYGDSSLMWTKLKLTWEGHELLASISNRAVWEEVKKTITDSDFPLEDIPLGVIKSLGDDIIRNKLTQ